MTVFQFAGRRTRRLLAAAAALAAISLPCGCAGGPSESLARAWSVPKSGVRQFTDKLSKLTNRIQEDPATLVGRSTVKLSEEAETRAEARQVAGEQTAGGVQSADFNEKQEQEKASAWDKLISSFSNSDEQAETLATDPFAPQENSKPSKATKDAPLAEANATDPFATPTATPANTTAQGDVIAVPAAADAKAGQFDSQLERLRELLKDEKPVAKPDPTSHEKVRRHVARLMQDANKLLKAGKLDAALARATAAQEKASNAHLLFGPDEEKPADLVWKIRGQIERNKTEVAQGQSDIPPAKVEAAPSIPATRSVHTAEKQTPPVKSKVSKLRTQATINKPTTNSGDSLLLDEMQWRSLDAEPATSAHAAIIEAPTPVTKVEAAPQMEPAPVKAADPMIAAFDKVIEAPAAPINHQAPAVAIVETPITETEAASGLDAVQPTAALVVRPNPTPFVPMPTAARLEAAPPPPSDDVTTVQVSPPNKLSAMVLEPVNWDVDDEPEEPENTWSLDPSKIVTGLAMLVLVIAGVNYRRNKGARG